MPHRKDVIGEQRDAHHVVALAPEHAAEPRAHRQDDRVGDQVAGQYPGAFVVAGAETARDVRQRDVRDAGVEQLHERRHRHRQRDRPQIVRCRRSGRRRGVRPDDGSR